MATTEEARSRDLAEGSVLTAGKKTTVRNRTIKRSIVPPVDFKSFRQVTKDRFFLLVFKEK